MADYYRRALEKAKREYETLLAKRTRLDERLARLTQTIGSLMQLCDLKPAVSLGLTDACRMVLKAAGQPLTAVDVRERLRGMGFDVDRYANDLASIHTVLKRLIYAGEIGLMPSTPSTYDRPAYRWQKRPPRVIVMSKDEASAFLGPGLLPMPTGRKKE